MADVNDLLRSTWEAAKRRPGEAYNDVTPYYSEEPAERDAVRRELTVPKDGVTKQAAETALGAIRNKELPNLDTGIIAKVNTNQADKLVSNAGIAKSADNGFSREQHYAVAANIESLWRHALLVGDLHERTRDPNVASIKRFAAPVVSDGETRFATILAKESVEHGHRLYTLELHGTETLRGMLDTLRQSPDLKRAPTRSVEETIRQLQEMVKPEQTGDDASSEEPADRADTMGRGAGGFAQGGGP